MTPLLAGCCVGWICDGWTSSGNPATGLSLFDYSKTQVDVKQNDATTICLYLKKIDVPRPWSRWLFMSERQSQHTKFPVSLDSPCNHRSCRLLAPSIRYHFVDIQPFCRCCDRGAWCVGQRVAEVSSEKVSQYCNLIKNKSYFFVLARALPLERHKAGLIRP